MAQKPTENLTTLWSTADFSTFNELVNDLVYAHTAGGSHSFQDYIVLDDGTFVLYETHDPGTGTLGTAVWTGTDLTDMTFQGMVLVEDSDCGVYYEKNMNIVHIYVEDHLEAVGPSSNKIAHYTTPDDDLLNATQQATAIDVTSESWHTGDPSIIEIGTTYYMFADRTEQHPNYRIAVFSSSDFYEWTLVQGYLNRYFAGGDWCLSMLDNGVYHCMTEYSIWTNHVAYWEMVFNQ